MKSLIRCTVFVLGIFIAIAVQGQNLNPKVKLEAVSVINRPDFQTQQIICSGAQVSLRYDLFNVAASEVTDIKWKTSGGTVEKTGNTFLWKLDGLTGRQMLVLQIFFTKHTKNSKEECTKNCYVYDGIEINVGNCTINSCKGKEEIAVISNQTNFRQGDTVRFEAAVPFVGKQNVGRLVWDWKTNNGVLSFEDNVAYVEVADLDLVANLVVMVSAQGDGECLAEGKVEIPRLVEKKEFVEFNCEKLKINQSRIDNTCKAVMNDVISSLKMGYKKVIITGYFLEKEKPVLAAERAKNAKLVLVSGQLGFEVQGNTIDLLNGGRSESHNTINIRVEK